jgi:hypothetical protein
VTASKRRDDKLTPEESKTYEEEKKKMYADLKEDHKDGID